MALPIPRKTPVLIVGAGPAGLSAALQLARHDTPCVLVERNFDTTKWPKMDVTNTRTMELFRENRLGVAEGVRGVGVPEEYPMDVLFSTGLSDEGELITKWDILSPSSLRSLINSPNNNDGSLPYSPYQRCSQAIFEAWLKPHIQSQALIKSFWGVKFENLTEHDDRVECVVSDVRTGEKTTVEAQYVLGCDGGGSKVRREIGGEMIGAPAPMAIYLVHFKSRSLSRLHRQGPFWHIFFSSGHVLIAQDEIDTWTLHTPIPLDLDVSTLDPQQAIYDGLGGSTGVPYNIDIDKILVSSVWRPNIFLADKYSSKPEAGNGVGRVFLVGDAAHQAVPTGGYGMNTAVGDSFDIGWKIPAVLAGYAGGELLRAYEEERMRVAKKNSFWAGKHWEAQAEVWGWVRESAGLVAEKTEEGRRLREKIKKHFEAWDGENKSLGVELGDRYSGSGVVVWEDEREGEEPRWEARNYVPSTWPGVRAPHVFLKDGRTSVFDLFGSGREFTIVDFTVEGRYAEVFGEGAKRVGLPLKMVHLPTEKHVRNVWERNAVLVRPDDHVCWRASEGSDAESADVDEVLLVVAGKKSNGHRHVSANGHVLGDVKDVGFAQTVGIVNRDEVERLGEMQGHS